jgi:hypothetical protein
MSLKENRSLPTRIFAVARNLTLLVVRNIPIWWRHHIKKKIASMRLGFASARFGWGVGAAYREMLDPDDVTFARSAGRRRIASEIFKPHPRTAVILAFGQSNIGNEGDPSGLYIPGSGVYNFNFLDGRCYVAKCPLLGAGCNSSNFVTRLGDLLVRRKIYDRVLLVPIALGGTYIADWAPGGRANFRLMITLELLRRLGITITHAIFQQGEAEGNQINADGAAWARNFNAMVKAVRLYGMEAPIYVAQCSLCCCDPNEIIRAAQRGVVDPARGIFAGPDTDTIGLDERWDGCHFSLTGLEKAAQLWFDTIAHHQPLITAPVVAAPEMTARFLV